MIVHISTQDDCNSRIEVRIISFSVCALSISINYNGETRKLQGNVTLNLFAVTGTGKEYVEPDISGLSLGETNIFEQ